MSIQANWKRGERYFWVSKSVLACNTISALLAPRVVLHSKCPNPKEEYHRVRIEVVRTKKEAKAAERLFAKRRDELKAKLEAKLQQLADAQKSVEWQTGTPAVAEGDDDTFWCQYEYQHNGETRIGYDLLTYRNKYVGPMGDNSSDPGPEAKEIGDGEYEWTGWFQQSCEHCDTFWAFSNKVVAWMKLPRRDAAMRQGGGE